MPSATADLASFRLTTAAIVAFILFHVALTRATWPRLRLLDWYRDLTIHHAHRRVGLGDVAILVGLKSAYYLLFVVVYYFGTQAFEIDLPFALVLAAAPIIQAVGGLPITPAGLGTQQAAMLYFFGESFGGGGSEAAIVAFGFSFPIVLILARCLLGLFYVRDLSAARTGLSASPSAASRS